MPAQGSEPLREPLGGPAVDGGALAGRRLVEEREEHGAHVGAVPDEAGRERVGLHEPVLAGQALEQLGGPDARGLARSDVQPHGRREHLPDHLGVDDADHQAGVGQPLEVLVVDAGEQEAVEVRGRERAFPADLVERLGVALAGDLRGQAQRERVALGDATHPGQVLRAPRPER